MIVNGCSDASESVCKEYEMRDKRFKVFYSDKGASRARNQGLRQAKGDYVAFVDADDFVYACYLERIADRAKITLRQYQRLESGERSILTCSFGLACRVIEALDMDVSKFYHGDYYLEEEVKTMRGKGIASRKKSSI